MAEILHNMMEDFVTHKLDLVINDLAVCKCERCRLDITSYTLNRLPPRYVVTTQGQILAKFDSLESQFDISVVATIASAAEIVKLHPRHTN